MVFSTRDRHVCLCVDDVQHQGQVCLPVCGWCSAPGTGMLACVWMVFSTRDRYVYLCVDGVQHQGQVCLPVCGWCSSPGTGAAIESEGRDRADLSLPGKQLQLMKDAVSYASSKPVVLLLFNAGPLDISWAKDNDAVKAIVECFLPAQATGEALRRMFLNENNANPAGRLPFTWPASMDQVPAMEDYTMDGRTYRYSTWDPLYPFGFGLSYAQFMYDYLHDHVLPTTIQPCDNVTAVVRVTNIGNVTGDEVNMFG
ncbi:hypothetical protein Bbelb_141110 [Branchiostoma belcheri]|nr:hypothetical protein Bbelb_141110 [Branchiostoma belcheri]